MIILGIDPGLATMGWGVINTDGSRLSIINYGTVITKPKMLFQDRLVKISEDVKELLTLYKPEEIVFEELFFSRNVTTALAVGAARGVAITSAAQYTDKLFEYTPMQIKQAVVGYGAADKHQVQHMVKLLLNLKEIPRPDDAADAVAAAICHANAGYARQQFKMK